VRRRVGELLEIDVGARKLRGNSHALDELALNRIRVASIGEEKRRQKADHYETGAEHHPRAALQLPLPVASGGIYLETELPVREIERRLPRRREWRHAHE